MNNQLLGSLLYILVFIGIFYFLLIRPQQKKQKQEKEMLESLKAGDYILTRSGIYGKVLNIKDDIITVEVGADKVKMKMAKWAVYKILKEEV